MAAKPNAPPYSLSTETKTRLIAALYGHKTSEAELHPVPPKPHFSYDANVSLPNKGYTHEAWLKALFDDDPKVAAQALVDLGVKEADRQVLQTVLALIDGDVALGAYRKIRDDRKHLEKEAHGSLGSAANLHDY
jgi:hypothetical protein